METFNYGNYAKARDASWRVLSENGISTLPVDAFALAERLGIHVYPYSGSKLLMLLMGLRQLCGGNDGLYVRFFGKSYIFYDDTVENKGRVRFTVAHEIGHHVLSHLKSNKKISFRPRCAERGRKPSIAANEREANMFAARLLAPSCVLHRLGLSTPEQISEVCGISLEAARYRAERLGKLNTRNRFNTSKLERSVEESFGEYIENRLKHS